MVRRIWSVAACAALSVVYANAIGVADIVNQISKDQYQNDLNTRLYTHDGNNRRAGTGAQHDPARDNISSYFSGLGLTTTVDHWNYNGLSGDNVVAELKGTGHPDDVYVFASHYDSVNCPGADDNGSGTAALLEAARVLSQYKFDATIRFITFDREEDGLYGSSAYVAAHSSENFKGMISLDMIAFNPNGANHANIYGRDAYSAWKNSLANSFALYGNGITTSINQQFDASDQAPFEKAGFNGCLLIENYSSNPNYHTTKDSYDTQGYLDFDYATNMTRAAVGCIATAANPVPEPAAMVTLALGLVGLASSRRRRR